MKIEFDTNSVFEQWLAKAIATLIVAVLLYAGFYNYTVMNYEQGRQSIVAQGEQETNKQHAIHGTK